MIVLLITHYERVQGWQNSSFTFIFWLLLVLSLTVTLRTKLIYILNKDKPEADIGQNQTQANRALFKLTDLDIWLFFVEYGLALATLVLYMCSEKFTESDRENKGSEPPEATCSLLARLTFWWSNSLISKIFSSN